MFVITRGGFDDYWSFGRVGLGGRRSDAGAGFRAPENNASHRGRKFQSELSWVSSHGHARTRTAREGSGSVSFANFVVVCRSRGPQDPSESAIHGSHHITSTRNERARRSARSEKCDPSWPIG